MKKFPRVYFVLAQNCNIEMIGFILYLIASLVCFAEMVFRQQNSGRRYGKTGTHFHVGRRVAKVRRAETLDVVTPCTPVLVGASAVVGALRGVAAQVDV